MVSVQQTPDELIRMGYTARREGQLEEAREIFSESVRLSREAANPPALAASLTGLGQIERDLKNSSAALQHYREALEIYRSGPDRQQFAHTIRHVGDILRGDGSIEEARPCYEEALKIYRADRTTTSLDLANTIRGFALLKESAGENEEAKTMWQEARGLYAAVQVEAGVKESERRIARLSGNEQWSPGE